MKLYEKFTKEQIQEIANQCTSFRQFCVKLGYSLDAGSATATVKECVEKYGIDCSHFKGHGWKRDSYDYSKFVKGKKIKEGLPALAYLRGWKCECCGNAEWNGQPIPLQIHHIDGDHLNNELDNLQLLCPNCHAQTDNYCGRNKQKLPSDAEIVSALMNNKSIRAAYVSLGVNYVAGYLYEKAYDLIEEYNITHLKR